MPTPASTPTPAPVQIDTLEDFQSTYLENPRTVRVYLPPQAAQQPERRFKVLYANDGQDMPTVLLHKQLERLYAAEAIEPLIVVAVAATEERIQEYGVAGVPDYQQRGSKAQAYSDFLLLELMPYINAHYPTLTGPENTAIMGWSLGGLSAFDLTWQHPEVFGTAGAFSGSFWWRTASETPEEIQAARIVHNLVRSSAYRPGLRFWFEAGTQDETSDRDGNGVIDAIQDTTELMDELALQGYRPGVDMVFVQVEGGKHDLPTWAKQLPEFLQWAFPAEKP